MKLVFEHKNELMVDDVKLVISTNDHTVAIRTQIDVGMFVGGAAGLLFVVLLLVMLAMGGM